MQLHNDSKSIFLLEQRLSDLRVDSVMNPETEDFVIERPKDVEGEETINELSNAITRARLEHHLETFDSSTEK